MCLLLSFLGQTAVKQNTPSPRFKYSGHYVTLDCQCHLSCHNFTNQRNVSCHANKDRNRLK